MVFLPFMVLFSGVFIQKIFTISNSVLKKIVITVFVVFLFTQIIESFSWVYIKLQPNPRQISSDWIVKNLSSKSIIGIENIPIYQFIPDIVLKEFYMKQYELDSLTRYNYEVIDASLDKLPPYVIVTNEEIDMNYLRQSLKKNLIARLKKENYKKIFQTKSDLSMLKMFWSEREYFISGLIQSPVSISIYKYIYQGQR